MEDLAEIIAEIFDEKVLIANVEGPNDAYATADPKRRCPDLTKINKLLDYTPKIDLRTGLKKFIQWTVEENNIRSPLIEALKKEITTLA